MEALIITGIFLILFAFVLSRRGYSIIKNMCSGKMDRETALVYLINKMLVKYKVTYSDVMANQYPEGMLWCQYYTWTTEEEEKFKEVFISTLMKRVKPAFTEEIAEKEWNKFNLMYGLKIENK